MSNRTFFFGSYEGTNLRRSQTTVFSVPTAAARSGNFAGLANICDPLTIPTTGVCQPFANNQIPASRIDPIAAAFLDNVPLPNASGNVQNLAATEELTRELHQFSARIDHQLGVSDQLSGRFSTFDADDLQPFGTSALQESLVPGFGRTLTTHTRNAMASHTRVFGTSKLNELRVSWMRVTGGQVGLNEGNPFASQVGLLGVSTDPRDTGFPQISTGGFYSTMGDPTVNTTRNTQHFELFENFTWDRGAHRLKFGAYYYNLRLRPVQADNARGAFTYTGQFSGNAFADFLLGYPTTAVSGIGRGDEDGRSRWLHVYAQDDWRARDNLTFNLGLRYEYNQHMYDADNRLSSIDLDAARFVIASDENDAIHSSADSLLPLIPIPYVTSNQAGWGRGLLDPSAVRLAPRLGFALSLNDSRAVLRGGYGIFLNQWAYSVQTAFARNLPFFFVKQVDVPNHADGANLPNPEHLDEQCHRHDRRQHHGFRVQRRVQPDMERRPAVRADASDCARRVLHGYVDARCRQCHGPQRPGTRPGTDPVPSGDSGTEPHQLDQIRRQVDLSRRHLKAERRLANDFAYNVSYTWSDSKDDASSPGPTEAETNFPQDVRNIFDETGEWALSSFNHTHQFIASGVYQFPFFSDAGGIAEAVLGNWRANAIFIAMSGSPFTVNLSVDRANVGAGPAQRPDQVCDPNDGPGTVTQWFNTSCFALQAPFTFGNAPRNSVVGPGFANMDFALAKTWRVAGASELEFRWEVFNLFNRANFNLPNRIFGNPNFGRISSAKNPREMQFGLRLSF